MKRIFTILGTIVCLLVGFLTFTPAVGQQSRTGWSQPLRLGPGWWQSITVDQEGRVHVGWYGEAKVGDGIAHDVLTYAALEPDGTWTVPNDVVYTGDGGYTVRNALAVTSDGILYAAFRAGFAHAVASAPARAAQFANLWSAPVGVDSLGYYMDMIKDRHDVLHFVYSGGVGFVARGGEVSHAELSPCATCNDMFYRRSTDGGKSWSEEVAISFEEDSGSDRMDIFEGASGRLYITWDEGYDWYAGRGAPKDVRIVYSDDGGLTWSDPIILDGGKYSDRRPIQLAAAELLDGSLLAVWRYSSNTDPNIYYQTSSDLGVTWTDPKPVPGLVARSMNDTPLDDYDLVVDRLGSASLFAVGQPGPDRQLNAALYHVQFRQGVWLAPVRVFYSRTLRPEWPKAAIGVENDIHLTFFTRGIEEGATKINATGDLNVYYAHYPGNLPAEIVAFNPTPIPPPTPTLVQNFEPTQTPFVIEDKVDYTVAAATNDTYAIQTLLSGLGAAALFCGIVFVVYRQSRS